MVGGGVGGFGGGFVGEFFVDRFLEGVVFVGGVGGLEEVFEALGFGEIVVGRVVVVVA